MSGVVYVARHGATAMNIDARHVSRSDEPLAPAGLREAEELAQTLRDVAFDAILSSPLTRARETAAAVAAAQPGRVAVRTDPRLVEVDFGDFEGLTREELVTGGLADAFAGWEDGGEGGGAEPLAAAAERAREVVESVDLDGTTLLVTHGVFARVLLASVALEMPLRAYRRLRLANGGYAVVSWAEGFPRLVYLDGRRADPA